MEGMYNKLLDLSDRFRDEMGDITDNVSLATALETAWEDLPSKTGTPLHCSPGVHHSACQFSPSAARETPATAAHYCCREDAGHPEERQLLDWHLANLVRCLSLVQARIILHQSG